MQWYYAKEGNQYGPFDDTEFRKLAREGKILPEDLVWNESLGEEWKVASSCSYLFFRPVDLQPPELQKEEDSLDNTLNILPRSNRELMCQARESLKGNWAKGVVATLLYLCVIFLLSFLASIFSVYCTPHQDPSLAVGLASHQKPNFVGSLLQILVSPPLVVGFCFYFLQMARRSQVQISQLFWGFRIFLKSLGTYLLIALFTLFWLLLFVLPVVLAFVLVPIRNWQQHGQHQQIEIAVTVFGLVALLGFAGAMVKIFAYSLTFLVLADEGSTGPLASIRRSKALMEGRKWKLVCLYFRFLGWWLIGLLTCGIGYLWVIPYMQTSLAHFYLDAKQQNLSKGEKPASLN